MGIVLNEPRWLLSENQGTKTVVAVGTEGNAGRIGQYYCFHKTISDGVIADFLVTEKCSAFIASVHEQRFIKLAQESWFVFCRSNMRAIASVLGEKVMLNAIELHAIAAIAGFLLRKQVEVR